MPIRGRANRMCLRIRQRMGERVRSQESLHDVWHEHLVEWRDSLRGEDAGGAGVIGEGPAGTVGRRDAAAKSDIQGKLLAGIHGIHVAWNVISETVEGRQRRALKCWGTMMSKGEG